MVPPAPPGEPCVIVIFGASGDLTKRLLMPALYNLACDGLLPERCAIVGVATAPLNDESFREKMSIDVRAHNTRPSFDAALWGRFVENLYYVSGSFDDADTFTRLGAKLRGLALEDNLLFYMATPPAVFGLVSSQLERAGFKEGRGWRRIVVEKPFGHDLPSAVALNEEILSHWSEDQIYRIDHYLGKETVQNLLAFRFSNGMFEPLWNRTHVDHIQFTVAETVGVESRGRYYDGAGVLRDMIQNHMFQMLAYLCMEPPSSMRADAVRNEKAKVLEAVRLMQPEDVLRDTARGQYTAGRRPDGAAVPGYREEKDVSPSSRTETFAALKLHIDNWRWEGVPIYLRSGKSLWKRGTEILVQFKRAPEVMFKGAAGAPCVEPNQLVFHMQPDQGIELRFHAKTPGPTMALQKVNMRFDYAQSFEAARGTGYEVLLYNVMLGDATLFSRSDLVEAAWRVAQPILDAWAAAPDELPGYEAGTWGPRAAYDLVARDGRRWLEVIGRSVLETVPLFAGAGAVFLHGLAMVLRPEVYVAGAELIRRGEPGEEMYFIAHGEAEVLAEDGRVLETLGPGQFFGEASLLLSRPRNATVRAKTQCDVYALSKQNLLRVMREHPRVAASLLETARSRYGALDVALGPPALA